MQYNFDLQTTGDQDNIVGNSISCMKSIDNNIDINYEYTEEGSIYEDDCITDKAYDYNYEELEKNETSFLSNDIYNIQNNDYEIPKSSAEIILIYTSLRGDLGAFIDSQMLIHLLNCKQTRWICLDINKDVIGSINLRNNKVLKQLDGIIEKTIPELIVDGVSVGTYINVLELENDGDLDYIFAQKLCPKCNEIRNEDFCLNCNTKFRRIIEEEDMSFLMIVDPDQIDRTAYINNPNKSSLSIINEFDLL